MPTVRVAARDLEFVLDNRSPGTNHYLDVETGEILPVFSFNQDRIMSQVKTAPGRYVRIGPLSGRQAYLVMREFSALVEDTELRELLEEALNHRHAFRAFRAALRSHVEEYRRWKVYRVEQMASALRERLTGLGLDLELVHGDNQPG